MELFSHDWVNPSNEKDVGDYPRLAWRSRVSTVNLYALAAVKHEANFEIQAPFWKSNI